ncbi:endolytic transglycosylase MltG [Listeria grandensis]|uniref:endolytic transglycosylase MltG n=1 Tax=Listeria grandensis TaxID=1494963 RepID=UPI001629896A|nr:endolytic transglycosylase MltG [Listeria grandensis]MBC1473619.1 endolytic transglycosylase MltG [Listeria grandensis]
MKKSKSKMITIIISSIAVVLVAFTVGGYFYVNSQLQAVNAASQKSVIVNIPKGSKISEIGDILEENNVINSSMIFTYYVKYKNETNLKAGKYKLSPSMTVEQVVNELKKGQVIAPSKLIIPEGYTLDQIADRMVNYQPTLKKEDILKTMDDKAFINELITKYPDTVTNDVLAANIKHPLEGYLYPATYEYSDKTDIKTMLSDMVQATDTNIQPYKAERTKQKMSVHKFLTMSSLIEKEATANVDRNKISSVFYNRLKVNMPLQTDPTVLYALGKHKSRTLYQDLKVDSPYNTYKNKGLPPGPISNSGQTSMKAALHPAQTDYLYFLANQKTGQVYFSKTLEEHNKLKEEHITNNQ